MMENSQLSIILEQIDNPTVRFTDMHTFIKMHQGLPQLSSHIVSFEGAEDPRNPLKFVLVDGRKLPRYRLYLNLAIPIDLKPLQIFLEKKNFYWMICSIQVFSPSRGCVAATTKCKQYLEQQFNVMWDLATQQIEMMTYSLPPPPHHHQGLSIPLSIQPELPALPPAPIAQLPPPPSP